MAGLKHLLTDFGILHILESCNVRGNQIGNKIVVYIDKLMVIPATEPPLLLLPQKKLKVCQSLF